ncbi:hypothetical protein AC579_3067 [Pseudocercospora musae]|uniref:Uncharacterized protein n=1 Tax=Pseudocercospora musae TaxID=113226 RepID=A0A139IK69_9PEZI|nr:hypothetical protein AC579_3067 [Pseudocercospora musae]
MPKVPSLWQPHDDVPPSRNYEADAQWRRKPLTPAQLMVHDVRLETLRVERGPLLEIVERSASCLVPDNAAYTPSASLLRISEATDNAIEKQRFSSLEEDHGWMRCLRLQNYQQHALDGEDSAKCRWMHCSSQFPEYIAGALWALSDDIATVADSMRVLDIAIQRQTRFSKHGKHFAPFAQVLQPVSIGGDGEHLYPFLVSVPFLDWTVQGPTPPLRFQVDRRDGFLSSRSSAHIVRSILQYYYRLEDTHDREGSQVFAKHKPWSTNREMDLKVRQWYGRYPTGLNVDELWILAIDAEHVVTFSSNQTWKSRWPPFQLMSRISDVSFRGIRNNYFSLSGAVGMLHRNFWPDLYLCMADRYAGHLGHLQYRLHRAPSTKLVMDLIACQEELNIVIQITEDQLHTINVLRSISEAMSAAKDAQAPSPVTKRPGSVKSTRTNHYGDLEEYDATHNHISRRSTYRQLSASVLTDPVAQLVDNLERELADLRDLRDNTDRLVTRTIQLVNIRLEDHGQAILVFTVVTIIFLPLNFVSSFFGMNFSDIRDMEKT